jgi:uncharacterized protein YecT (DUF1311 family)
MTRPLLALLALLVASPSLAQAPRDCAKAVSTPEINACEADALDRADKALNIAYRATLARVDKADMEAAPRAEWRKAVQEAQRRWIAFRDADCDGAVAFEWYGGTGATAAVLACKRAMTEARTKELRERGNP